MSKIKVLKGFYFGVRSNPNPPQTLSHEMSSKIAFCRDAESWDLLGPSGAGQPMGWVPAEGDDWN